jgi:hypothetical protein
MTRLADFNGQKIFEFFKIAKNCEIFGLDEFLEITY